LRGLIVCLQGSAKPHYWLLIVDKVRNISEDSVATRLTLSMMNKFLLHPQGGYFRRFCSERICMKFSGNNNNTKHIQKAWDGPVAAHHRNTILSRVPSDVDKARLVAAASPHSGDWLQAPPITAVGLRLSDEAIRVVVAHWLGCKACEPHTCACGKPVDARGLHGYPAVEALPDNNVTVI